MTDVLVYWGSGSAPCMRVLITLQEKQVQYNEKILSFGNQEHKSAEVLRLNPRGQLPTVKHGNLVLNESLATIQFLEAQYKGQGTKLLPDAPAEQALVYQRMFEALNYQKTMIEGIFLYARGKKPEELDQELWKTKLEAARKELQIWDGYLAKLGRGSFIASKNFSLADVILFPYVAFIVRLGLKIEKYPNLAAYYNIVKERPSVKKSWPPHWKTGDNGTLLENL